MSLASALLALQAEAPKLIAGKTGQIQSRQYKYLDLGTIIEKITPLLKEQGLTWTTRPTGTHDAPTLTYALLWEGENDRESISGEMPLFLGDNTSQAFGSAITYARRYAMLAVLNLVGDDDDDGKAAGGQGGSSVARGGSYGKPQDATPAQKKKVRAEATKAGLKDEKDWAKFTTMVIDEIVPVDNLTKAQASSLIDRLMQGAIPTGKSDVPDDAGEFEQPKLEGGDPAPFEKGT